MWVSVSLVNISNICVILLSVLGLHRTWFPHKMQPSVSLVSSLGDVSDINKYGLNLLDHHQETIVVIAVIFTLIIIDLQTFLKDS